MPRIATARPPAQPTTPQQRERSDRVLGVAARLGAAHGLEHVQMTEVAHQAGVALGTLYRYYPSKNHLFAAVMLRNVGRAVTRPPRRRSSPAGAVADFMGEACAAMLRHPKLARAMITATNAVRSEPGLPADTALRDRIIEVAGITDPTPDDVRRARLVEQCAYGVLTWAVAGETTADEAVEDIRRACLLLLGQERDLSRRG